MSSDTQARNVWLSRTECGALINYLSGIEQGLFQLRQDRMASVASERQAFLYIEQGCLGLRQILEALGVTTGCTDS
jgi:hypothetical protein